MDCNNYKKKLLEIIVFGIGNGDCIHVELPDRQFLIDAGFSSTYNEVKKRLLQDEKRVDFVVLTHDHADHISGFMNLMNDTSFKVNRIIYWTENPVPSPSNSKKIRALISKAIKKDIHLVSIGHELHNVEQYLGKGIEVLHPRGDLIYDSSHLNSNSIVLAFNAGENCLLFMGDATNREEKVIINRPDSTLNLELSSTKFLKVGHHGSATSSSREFLGSIVQNGFDLAVVSCKHSRNRKPPSPSKLSEIEHIVKGVRGDVFCTGENGENKDITIKVFEENGVVKVERQY